MNFRMALLALPMLAACTDSMSGMDASGATAAPVLRATLRDASGVARGGASVTSKGRTMTVVVTATGMAWHEGAAHSRNRQVRRSQIHLGGCALEPRRETARSR